MTTWTTRFFTLLIVASLFTATAQATPLNTILRWDIPIISEDQVKNSMADPPGDGSTNSNATGWAEIEIKDNPSFLSGDTILEDEEYLIRLTVNWDGLEGDLTKIHIHGWLDPMGNPIGPDNSTPTHLYEVPGLENESNTVASGVDRRSDTYVTPFSFLSHTHPFDDVLQNISPSDIIEEFKAGRAYFNVHSTAHPMGEIRGNLEAVPEPSGLLLAVVGITFLAMGRLKRRR